VAWTTNWLATPWRRWTPSASRRRPALDSQVAMRRLLGMLARKGYPAGLAMAVIREELDASADELPVVDDAGFEPT